MLVIWAMAKPTRWTSLGPICRRTWAASASPRDSNKMAAFSTLLIFATTLPSVIAIDPFFDHLSHTARIICYQIFDGAKLCIILFDRTWQENGLSVNTEAKLVI